MDDLVRFSQIVDMEEKINSAEIEMAAATTSNGNMHQVTGTYNFGTDTFPSTLQQVITHKNNFTSRRIINQGNNFNDFEHHHHMQQQIQRLRILDGRSGDFNALTKTASAIFASNSDPTLPILGPISSPSSGSVIQHYNQNTYFEQDRSYNNVVLKPPPQYICSGISTLAGEANKKLINISPDPRCCPYPSTSAQNLSMRQALPRYRSILPQYPYMPGSAVLNPSPPMSNSTLTATNVCKAKVCSCCIQRQPSTSAVGTNSPTNFYVNAEAEIRDPLSRGMVYSSEDRHRCVKDCPSLTTYWPLTIDGTGLTKVPTSNLPPRVQEPKNAVVPVTKGRVLQDYATTSGPIHCSRSSTIGSARKEDSAFLTEKELDSLVSKIAEEANSYQLVVQWPEHSNGSLSGPSDTVPTGPELKQTCSFLCTSQQHPPRRLRKQAKPQCSAKKDDPDFKGVLVRMQIKLEDHRCKLRIQSSINIKLSALTACGKRARHRKCCGVPISTSSENSYAISQNTSKNYAKQCCSCGTTKTPCWRDAEHGIALCNACGIRYMKHRIRCGRCWHIPRHDTSKPFSRCGRCGSPLCYTLMKQSIIQCDPT